MDRRDDTPPPNNEQSDQLLMETAVEVVTRNKVDTMTTEFFMDDGSTLILEMDFTTSFYELENMTGNLVRASDVPHVKIEPPTPDNPDGGYWEYGAEGTSSTTSETQPPESGQDSSATGDYFSFSSLTDGPGASSGFSAGEGGESSAWDDDALPDGLAWSKGSFMDNMPAWLEGTTGFVSYDVRSYVKK